MKIVRPLMACLLVVGVFYAVTCGAVKLYNRIRKGG